MEMRELYQRTFSQVHSSSEIRWETYASVKRRRLPRNLLTAAAAILLLAGLSTAAVASDLFGLRSWLLPEKISVGTMEEISSQADAISLSGYLDTPEGKATAEWQAFLESYDVEAAAREADRTGTVPEGYGLYQAYNGEMTNKVDEIVEKYGLRLHTALFDVYEAPEIWDTVAAAFQGHEVYSAYFYEDGTLHYDGAYRLPDYGQVDYQFSRYVRGTFNEVILNVGDMSAYEEWTYESACGRQVTLALGPDKALVLAELPDSVVSLNVLAGTETDLDDVFSSGPFSAENLEALADSFDFACLTPALPVTAPEQMLPEEDAVFAAAGIQEEAAQDFFSNLCRLLEEDRREEVVDLLAWPQRICTPEGETTLEQREDVLLYYDEMITSGLMEKLQKCRYDAERADLIVHDGMVGAAEGALWFALVEDGRIALMTVQNPEGYRLQYDASCGE